jgi:hypothetical protein
MKAAGGDDMVLWIVGGTVAGMAGLAIWADDKGETTCPPPSNGAELGVAVGCGAPTVFDR